MTSARKKPAAKFTIPATGIRIASGLFFVILIVWLGCGLHKDDLALFLPETKYNWQVRHFHGLGAWLMSGAVFCFAACAVSCLTLPLKQTLHRWLNYLAWGFFIIGLIVIPIWQTHGKQLPQASDIWIFCFAMLCVCFLITLVNLMVATIPDDWNLFVKHYPPQARPTGNAYHALDCAGQRVILTEDGIYFYKVFLARPGHPPFLLPWARVKSIRKRRGFFRNAYRFEIKDAAAKLQLDLPESIEQEFSRLKKKHLVD